MNKTELIEYIAKHADVLKELNVDFRNGFGDLVSKIAKLPADKKAEIVAGKFAVFAGPIKAQDGSIKVPAGKSLTDKEIDSINWYVEGVEGKLPGFNSTAFIFQVKNRFRSDYMDVQRAEVTGKDGGPIQTEAVVVDSSQLTPETRAALRAALEATLEESEDE